jgi:hypothetical protein
MEMRLVDERTSAKDPDPALACLLSRAPDIVETILKGKQPPNLTANRVATLPTIPTDWNKQRQIILDAPDC